MKRQNIGFCVGYVILYEREDNGLNIWCSWSNCGKPYLNNEKLLFIGCLEDSRRNEHESHHQNNIENSLWQTRQVKGNFLKPLNSSVGRTHHLGGKNLQSYSFWSFLLYKSKFPKHICSLNTVKNSLFNIWNVNTANLLKQVNDFVMIVHVPTQ
jgi:hypothetical protein